MLHHSDRRCIESEQFLTGEFVYLRAPREADVRAGHWHQWFNDQETIQYTRHGVYPNTIDTQLEFLNTLRHDQTRLVLAVCAKDEEHIGVVSLQAIDLIDRKAEAAVIIGSRAYRGGFYGLEAMALITDHGFSRLNLNKIYGGMHENLAPWGRLLGALGYREEAVLPEEFLRSGRYFSMIRLACYARDFYELKERHNGDLDVRSWFKFDWKATEHSTASESEGAKIHL